MPAAVLIAMYLCWEGLAQYSHYKEAQKEQGALGITEVPDFDEKPNLEALKPGGTTCSIINKERNVFEWD